MLRDLQKDLELCKRATQETWEWEETNDGHRIYVTPKEGQIGCESHHEIEYGHYCFYECAEDEDAPVNVQALEAEANTELIAEAFQGWPHAIERAIKAEARVKELEKQLNNTSDAYKEIEYRFKQYAELVSATNSKGECKLWVPDEDNHLESLMCPVIIPAEWLRNLLDEARKEGDLNTVLPFGQEGHWGDRKREG